MVLQLCYAWPALRKRKENPLWSDILQHSWPKVLAWGQRVLDKWNFKISEIVKTGRQPQLRSAAVCAVYRDAGREKEVWRMACLMQHYDQFFQDNLSPEQYQVMLVQWSSGRLDSRLTGEVVSMRPDFKPQDLAFLFQEMLVEHPSNYLEDASHKEQSATLERFVKKLRLEQATFRREVALRKAADGNYMGLHATWQQKIEEAVDELWEAHQPNYQVFASPDLACGHRSLIGARADLVGLDVMAAGGVSKAELIPSICVWNLPMLGAQASTMIPAICNVIADDCANNPLVTIHLMCPPNQGCYGKTTDPDADVRASDVQEHVDRWWAALHEPGRELSVVKACAHVCPNYNL